MNKKISPALLAVCILLSGCGTITELIPGNSSVPETSAPSAENSSAAETSAPEEETAAETEDGATEPETSVITETETETSAPEEPAWKWKTEPKFDYDYAGVIRKGHTSFDFFTAEYLDYDTVWHSNLCVYGKNGKFGVTDYEGNVLTDPVYDTIRVGVGEKCILEDDSTYQCREITRSGSLTPPVDSEYYQEVTNGWPGICWSSEEKRLIGLESGMDFGYPVDSLTAYPVREGVRHIENSDYIWYDTDWENGKYALVTGNELVTDFIYEDAGRLHEGIIPVKKGGKWGYVDRNGNTVIDFAYDDAWERNRSWHIIDSDNSHYTDWTAFDATEGTVVLCQNGGYALYSVSGEEIIPFGELEEISPLYEGKAWAKSGGLWGIIEVSYDKPETAETVPVSGGLTEAQLYARAQDSGFPVAWTYADFDGDGSKEAFFILVTDGDIIDTVCFIDASGTVTRLPEDYDSLSYYEDNNGYYAECQGKGFFFCDYGAYGSGWRTMLYSVKDGKPYQLDIAPELQGFYHKDDRFYTTQNDFSAGYHEYPEYELVYDAENQQFRFQ